MCNLTTDYEMQLAVLKAQNEGRYKDEGWEKVVIEERISNQGDRKFKVIDVKSHELSIYFDMEGRFVSIVNYEW